MKAKALLLDIEGTTTSIAFVYDVLFPYAREHVREFLEAHFEDAEVKAAVASIREQAHRDRQAGLEGAVAIPESGDDTIDRVVQNVIWQMDNDRKTTGLKSLQGMIWKHGYASGQLRAHVFADVRPAFERWSSDGIPIYIYSSGSIAAQKLLFGHSEAGDLRRFLDDYFDTTTGPKKEARSYRQIAETIGVETQHIVFATDNLDEARASDDAGMKAIIMDRPSNTDPGPHDFEVHRDFKSIELERG